MSLGGGSQNSWLATGQKSWDHAWQSQKTINISSYFLNCFFDHFWVHFKAVLVLILHPFGTQIDPSLVQNTIVNIIIVILHAHLCVRPGIVLDSVLMPIWYSLGSQNPFQIDPQINQKLN